MTSRRAFLGRMFSLSKEPAAAGLPESAHLERSGEPAPAAWAGHDAPDTPARLAAQAYGAAMHAAFGGEGGEPALPPDFTPAFLRLEAERLGLDARMPESELVRAVLAEMNAIRPPDSPGISYAAARRCPRPRRGRKVLLRKKDEGRGSPA